MRLSARDSAIVAAYNAGERLEAIGRRHGGLSRQRIEQIARAAGAPRRCPSRGNRYQIPWGPGDVSGEQLVAEIEAAAKKAGKSISAFVAPIFSGSWKIEQLRIATKPTPLTVRRVRALIAGEPIPPGRGRYERDPRAYGLSREEAEAAGIPPSGRSRTEKRSLEAALAFRSRIELAKDLADVARETRRPGQTLDARVRELQREIAQ